MIAYHIEQKRVLQHLRKLAWLKLQYVTIPQDPEAVALQPAQFSDHLLAELRFKVSN